MLLYILLIAFSGVTSLPLNVEVQWSLQSQAFTFTGFMVETLGFMDALLLQLPQLRLVQSFFTTSLDESPLEDGFMKQLFPKERINLLRLTSLEQNLPDANVNAPKSLVFGTENVTNAKLSLCDVSSGQSVIKEGFAIHGGNMMRPLYSFASDPESCCIACASQPLCIAWSFHDSACTFKNTDRGPNVTSIACVGCYSGSFHKNMSVLPGGRFPLPRVTIFHGTTCVQANESIKVDPNVVTIGRFMLERGTFLDGFNIHEFSVSACSARLNEIWVPTEWHMDVFRSLMNSYGFPSPRISVIPEAVDTTLFDPAFYEGDNCLCNDRKDICPNQRGRPFTFISIFKWETRKGWDILLKAYWSAFSASDNVLLKMRTYLPSHEYRKSKRSIDEIIREFALKEFGKSVDELAPISYGGNAKVIGLEVSVEGGIESMTAEVGGERELSREGIRDFLYSADAFVLPTRGEGWGLPIAEAMSMALPVIVSDVPGPHTYANNENSYLIPVLPDIRDDGFYEVNTSALVEILRMVRAKESTPEIYDLDRQDMNKSCCRCQYPKLSSAKGLQARRTMQKYSADIAVSIMVSRIKSLVEERGWIL